MDTQGLDYGSESRHNCVRGKTVDVEGRGGKGGDEQLLSPAADRNADMYIPVVFETSPRRKKLELDQ